MQQMIWQGSYNSMCFIASPVLESFDDMAYFGLNMNDFAIHDPTKDVLFSQSISSASPAAVSTRPPTTVDKSVGSLPTPLSEPKEASDIRNSSDTVKPSGLLGTLFGSKLNSNYPANKKAKKLLATARSEVSNEYPSSLATSNESLSSSQSIKTLKESNSSHDIPSVHNNAITPTLCPRISQPGTTDNCARLECAFKEVNSTHGHQILLESSFSLELFDLKKDDDTGFLAWV